MTPRGKRAWKIVKVAAFSACLVALLWFGAAPDDAAGYLLFASAIGLLVFRYFVALTESDELDAARERHADLAARDPARARAEEFNETARALSRCKRAFILSSAIVATLLLVGACLDSPPRLAGSVTAGAVWLAVSIAAFFLRDTASRASRIIMLVAACVGVAAVVADFVGSDSLATLLLVRSFLPALVAVMAVRCWRLAFRYQKCVELGG
jgi:hypothetical protein